MNKYPSYLIPKPCNKQWSNMQSTDMNDCKMCLHCNEQLHDLRNKTTSEIDEWYNKQDSNGCVIIEAEKLSTNKLSSFNLVRKIGFASLLLGSSLINYANAQEHTKADSFSIQQSEIQSQTITIQGKVKVKKLLGWQSLKEYSINVFSNNSLVTEVLIDERGKFKIELNRSIFSESMTISIHALNYKSLKIENIEVKSTDIKVYLDEQDFKFITGRFF